MLRLCPLYALKCQVGGPGKGICGTCILSYATEIQLQPYCQNLDTSGYGYIIRCSTIGFVVVASELPEPYTHSV